MLETRGHAAEAQRRRWLEDQAAQLQQTKDRSADAVRTAKTDINRESAAARDNLAATSAGLADEIVSAVIGRGAHV